MSVVGVVVAVRQVTLPAVGTDKCLSYLLHPVSALNTPIDLDKKTFPLGIFPRTYSPDISPPGQFPLPFYMV